MRTAVIVGVGPGLGFSLAKRFGKENFKIALVARREDELAKYAADLSALGVEAAGFPADVADERQLQEAFNAVKQRFGFIDLLIYNAAVIQPVHAAQATAHLPSPEAVRPRISRLRAVSLYGGRSFGYESGLLPGLEIYFKISSIRFNVSSPSSTPDALAFSVTCSGRLAPTSALATLR